MSGPGFLNPAGGTPGGNGGAQVGNLAQDFYVYSAYFGSLASGGSSVQNLQVQADSDFEWIMTTCVGILHSGTAPYGNSILLPISVQVTDSGSGRSLFSAPLLLSGVAGSGAQPFILPISRLFKSRSNISIAAQNLDSNQYDFLTMNFIGRKIFTLSPN